MYLYVATCTQIKSMNYIYSILQFGDSAVQYAAYNGHMEAVKLLVEFHHADVTFVNQVGYIIVCYKCKSSIIQSVVYLYLKCQDLTWTLLLK